MIQIKDSSEDLSKSGVYFIKCIPTKKVYIGSTTMRFIKRFWHHSHQLSVNEHKNSYLQEDYNKYGESNFIIAILEICDKSMCIKREQFYMDLHKCYDREFGYNINPIASKNTVDTSKETVEKRRQTMLRKYANGEIIPHFKGKETWNKGLTKENHDYSYLKVKKTITPTVLESRKARVQKNREFLFNKIFVYKKEKDEFIFLGEWRSAKDLQEYSITDECTLPIVPNKVRHTNPKLLQSVSINKSCKTGKPYKNLYFSFSLF